MQNLRETPSGSLFITGIHAKILRESLANMRKERAGSSIAWNFELDRDIDQVIYVLSDHAERCPTSESTLREVFKISNKYNPAKLSF